ncbi:MAG: 3-keto-disaccharide hydrolase, partial [Planctomycetota bacterium]
MARKSLLSVVVCGFVVLAGCATQQTAEEQGPLRQYVETDTGRWLIHDVNRPAPPVVTPGDVPSDAVVLFDGTDLSAWTDTKRRPSKWVVRDGYMESVKGAGYIQSKRQFGSCQLHVEFATPSRVSGSGQGRGNSGVFLMGTYEVQVLDSYDNHTYPDGQCAALYGRNVPLVNASARPGEWQS